jgi:hypothetical protein
VQVESLVMALHRVAAIVAGVVAGGSVSKNDAAWLVQSASAIGGDGTAGAIWSVIATVCATGDAVLSRSRLGSANAVSAAVAAVTRRRVDSASDCGLACLRALASLCGSDAAGSQHRSNATVAVACGAIPAVVDTLRVCAASEAVTVDGSVVLRHLAHDNDSACAQIEAAGGVETLLLAMRRHAASQRVQASVCSAVQPSSSKHLSGPYRQRRWRQPDAVSNAAPCWRGHCARGGVQRALPCRPLQRQRREHS